MFNDAGVVNQGVCDPNGRCYDVFKVKEAVDRLKVRAILCSCTHHSR